MTGNEPRRATPGPPWSVDLLADLHAGVLDPRDRGRAAAPGGVRPRGARRSSPRSTRRVADLASLPPIPMPPRRGRRGSTRRWPPRPRPPRRWSTSARRAGAGTGGSAWERGVLAAAAVGDRCRHGRCPGRDTRPQRRRPHSRRRPQPARHGPPLAVAAAELGAVVGDVLKAQNYGPLDNQDRLVGCLRGGGITSTAQAARRQPGQPGRQAGRHGDPACRGCVRHSSGSSCSTRGPAVRTTRRACWRTARSGRAGSSATHGISSTYDPLSDDDDEIEEWLRS